MSGLISNWGRDEVSENVNRRPRCSGLSQQTASLPIARSTVLSNYGICHRDADFHHPFNSPENSGVTCGTLLPKTKQGTHTEGRASVRRRQLRMLRRKIKRR